MARPKLEGRMTASSAWVISVTDSGGTDAAISVAAADYYLTTASTGLLATLQTALNASGTLAGTYTVSLADDADTDTGKVTISATGAGNITLTWSNTDIRDRLGFTGDVSGAATHTSPEQAEYLFLPTSGRDSSLLAPDGNEGAKETDLVDNISPDGTIVSTQYETRKHDSLGFQMTRGASSWIDYETTVNASFEKFFDDVIGAGRPFRYHKARETDGTFVTWQAMNIGRIVDIMTPRVADWHSANALFDIRFDVRKKV